jgi:hypothetical protein
MQPTILRLTRKAFDKEHISGEVGRDGLIRYMTEEKRREGADCGSPFFSGGAIYLKSGAGLNLS